MIMIDLLFEIRRTFIYSGYEGFVYAKKQEPYYYTNVKRQIR